MKKKAKRTRLSMKLLWKFRATFLEQDVEGVKNQYILNRYLAYIEDPKSLKDIEAFDKKPLKP